ncbi:phage tail protein [Serratia marcescens]|uniref:phage tail protein n=1 Tax=Serratia marcescens TaxID=615 RepID=UPI0021ADF5A6|nr:phage tail protein [Serratia marcescens]MDH2251252.1 phage tail protein [Serratia marcescens]MDH2257713.1 phage tail protein [Serratia marcescens]MDH2260221.1 phage tail protein [Serratia marcescens]MDP5270349.1 phage tail protein [Serratia marcescens]
MNKYKAIITTAGAAKIAAASAGGTQLKIVSMAVGDGNGTLPTPDPAQTKLVNEKYRAALNGLTIDKALKNHILAEMIIPANRGGWWLREMGLYDEAGTLIAVSNMAESYKPKLEEGSGRTQTLRMILIVSSTEAVQVIAGGDTVLATKDFVADAIAAHEKTRNHPDASTTAKGLVQLSSATTSTDETKASTPKALKTVSDASMKKAANLSDLPDKAAARGNLALGTAATKNVGVAGGQLMEVGAFGLGSGSRHREDAYCNQGEIYRVNSSSKNAPGGDVYGVLSLPCDGGPSGAYMAVQNNGNAFFGRSNIAENGVTWFQAYTTKFKPTAADVGAWSKTEADGRFLMLSGGTVKKLAIKSGNAETEGSTLNIEGNQHTPLVMSRLSAQGNLSIGFQVAGKALMRLGVGADDELHWGAEANQASNPRIYTTAKPPTAQETGALTDAQAVQKYALRSIKVNGKPLSGDVNLLAGDVNAWNKTEADGRYVKQTGDTMKGALTLPRIVFPNENTANADDDLNRENGFTVESLVATTNKGYPVPGGMGVLFTGKVNEFRNVQFAVGSGNMAFYLRSMRKDSAASLRWARVYTTDYKPTAADVGALTDAQAAQKYALRSIKVNGKPLSADVNLLAGDVNAWNKTEADGRYLAKTGGNITGGVSSSSWVSAAALTSDYHGTGDNTNKAPEGAGAYSNQLGTRAPFYQTDFQWEANSGAIYVPLVKGKSTRKGKGWPTAVSYGYLMPGENMHAHPVIHALGDGVESIWQFNTQTGGIISGKMGEFASQAWVNNGLNGRVDWPSFNQHVGARATIDWVNQNFIQNVRYSAEMHVGATGIYTYHDNTVLTGFNNKDGDYSAEELFWSYIQIYKNGQWITVGR